MWRHIARSRFVKRSYSNVIEKKSYQVTTYARPDDLCITRGSNTKLYDDINKKEYVDFTAGIAVTALGHSNKHVAEILSSQAAKLIHSSNLYYNEECLKLSEKLVTKTRQFGGQHDAARVFLCNSGAEANEAAMKFARKNGVLQSPQKQGFMALQNSFHGRTIGALSVTWNSNYREPFGDLLPHVEFMNINDELNILQDLIAQNSDKLAGIILEPIQGEGGIFPIPIEKLIGLKDICSKNNIVVIYDEIQCGLGRTGKLWAHSYLPAEAHPDIFTTAKALGNGFPIAATIVNEKINSALQVGDHGTTYGGNALGSAVANYVLDVIGNEDFLKQVNEKSDLLQARLQILTKLYPKQIRECRGKGLMLGLEFDHQPLDIVKRARELGLLVLTAGKTTIRFVPALTIDNESIEHGMNIFEQAVKEVLEK